ncbi:MAG: MFS transporter [Actinomycetota bacterium]|nr:MFS transporter [Actinomycetota bacterium]
MNKSDRVFGVKKNIVLLGLVSMFADISSEMIYPFIPIFLADVLKVRKALIGLIEGVAESTASISVLFSGWFSDKIKKRKALAVLGYSVGVVSRPLLGLATTWSQALGLRFLDRVGKGVRAAPRDAIIADSVAATERGRAFGFHRMLDTVGAIIGPLLGAGLLYYVIGRTNYRLLFMLAGIPALIAVAILALFVAEKRAKGRDPKLPGFRLALFPIEYKMFLVIIVLFGLGNSSNVFLILRAKSLGVSPVLVTMYYVAFSLTYAGFSYPAGILSDAIGRRSVLIIGYLAFALVYVGLALAARAVYMLPLFILYGTFPALTDGVQRAFAADMSPAHLRASGLGLYHFLNGLSLLPASIIGGWLWDAVGPKATFLYGAATATLAVLIFVFVWPRISRSPLPDRSRGQVSRG